MSGTTRLGRVLIIDDDLLVLKMMAAHVRAAGYAAEFTSDPEEFYAMARSWSPTYVVVDLVMGKVDGLTVLKKLAEMNSNAVVVIASGMGSSILDSARQFAAASGLAYGGVLHKPFRRADVAAVLAAGAHSPGPVEPDTDELDAWDAAAFELELRNAATSGDFALVFQPKVSCVDSSVVGYEALVRWDHPELGMIPPSSFVPRAESAGLITVVTDWVAAEAFGWFARSRHHTDEHLSINVSASELTGKDLCERMLKAAAHAQVSPGRIILEVTETSAIADAKSSLEVLTRLRLGGFQLSIDDFGTGYSSMTQLSDMPFTEIKIDRSFVQKLGKSGPSDVMVRSMVQLGSGLGIRCTAEGVETVAALKAVTEMGCDYAQGYFIAFPMDEQALEAWLVERLSLA
ncbi:EAL domain-containing response regulator [Demequina aurantiaca]|uniref:EAL domain-containing response regulator n=1 Tax=Demequina aurantiaca TaxID=676200 RepID=UPI003D32D5AC